MRRVGLFGCLMVCILLFSACANQQSPTPVTLDFSCRFCAQYDGMETTGTIERTADKVLTVTFDSPDTLSGISLIWNGDEVRMRIFGIETALPQSYLPQSAFGTVLGGALDDAINRVGNKNFDADGYTLSGTLAEYSYTLRCDRQSGIPLELDVPGIPLFITFSEFTSN